MSPLPDAWIFDAVRTPRGRGKETGALYTTKPLHLLTTVLDALRTRNALDTRKVDDVVVGCVTQVGDQGACIARTAALMAGWDHGVPGVTLNRFCASGLEAVNHAAAMVASGLHDLVVAGGVESMSRVKMGSDGGAFFDPEVAFAQHLVPQGVSADLLATLHDVSRAAVDAYALQSQRRAVASLDAGRFDRSVVPVKDENGATLLAADEMPRRDATPEALARLAPSFAMMGEQFGLDAMTRRAYPHLERLRHVHHAGNSSGIVDGAAAVLVGRREVGEALGLRPRARIRAAAVCGDEPVVMLTGPIPATEKALLRSGMRVSDIDHFEVNEAFAAVPIVYGRRFGLPDDKLNPLGGAIALGHPLGATGAMLLCTALDALEDKGLGTALITLCVGGGMGIATIIERV